MDEKNKNNVNSEKAPKLTYEELAAYTQQTIEQAKKLYQENQVLKQTLKFRDIEYAFRCLDHADKFSPEFIKVVINRLEEIMNPQSEDKEEAEKED